MSTRTIAVDSEVNDRLAGAKRKGESFSKVIDRLLGEVAAVHAGSDILRRLAASTVLPDEGAKAKLALLDAASPRWRAQGC